MICGVVAGNNDNVANIAGANDNDEGITGHYIPFCIGKSTDGEKFSTRKVYYDMTDDKFVINGGTIKTTSIYSSTLEGGSIIIGDGTGYNPVFTVDSTGKMTSKGATINGALVANGSQLASMRTWVRSLASLSG